MVLKRKFGNKFICKVWDIFGDFVRKNSNSGETFEMARTRKYKNKDLIMIVKFTWLRPVDGHGPPDLEE